MHIQEAVFIEEAMDGLGHNIAHPEGGLEGIGAGPEVLHGAQILKAVALFLHGIAAVAEALYGNFLCLYLKRLLCVGSEHQFAQYPDGAAGVYLAQYIFWNIVLIDHLNVPEAGAVRQLDKADILAVPHGTHPAGYLYPRTLRDPL